MGLSWAQFPYEGDSLCLPNFISPSMITKALFFWLGIAFLEMIHGILRAKFLAPRVGDLRSRQIGVATGSVLVLAYAWLVFPFFSFRAPEEAIQVGGLWLACMLLFEFGVGRFVFHFSWKWLLNDFNFFRGRLLALGMLVLALAPWLSGRLRGLW